MRKLTAIVIACLCMTNALAQEGNFTLTIHANRAKATDKAYLCYQEGNQFKIDSVAFVNGACTIKGKAPAVLHAGLYITEGDHFFMQRMNMLPALSVFLEEGNILLDIPNNFEEAQISGTATNDVYQNFLNLFRPFKKKGMDIEKAFNQARAAKDSLKMKSLQDEYTQVATQQQAMEHNFFEKHLDSFFSLDWLSSRINISNQKKEATILFNKLSSRIKDSTNGKEYSQKLAATPSVELGSIAPEISSKTPSGQNISLNAFRGKYLLIDFWASWCMPCRGENPNVIKAYEKYKSKNFEILGISLDSNKAAWENAIAKDKLTWTQVSDLKGGQSVTAMTYGIQSIPSNFLLDPTGKIIAKNLRGEELEKKLNELFN